MSSEESGYNPPRPLHHGSLKLKDFIPKSRIMNHRQFNTLFTQKDNCYIIHALKGGINPRNEKQKKGPRSRNAIKESTKGHRNFSSSHSSNASTDVLHMVRIHSPCIFEHLHHVAGRRNEFWDVMRPRIFCRPFRLLVHYHHDMKKALENLEQRWKEMKTIGVEAAEKMRNNRPAREYADSEQGLLHMREYIRFTEAEVIPSSSRFENTDARVHRPAKVPFTDLWYLYREGELVYSPVPSNGSASNLQASHQTCWCVYAVITPEPSRNLESTEDKEDSSGAPSDLDAYNIERTTRVCCYYIDFDGESYGPVTHQFVIQEYQGEKDIASLPIYPPHLMAPEEYDRFMKDTRENGMNFTEFVKAKHLYHHGWTLTRTPLGAALGGNTKYPEHIDSEVIVDFDEAFHSLPSWRPEFQAPSLVAAAPARWRWDDDNCVGSIPITVWSSDPFRPMYHLSDDITHMRRNAYLLNDKFLRSIRNHEGGTLVGKDLQLLPRRLVVFALQERKFVNVCVTSLRRIVPQIGIFDKLSIDPRNKSMVRALVQEHFRKKANRDGGKPTPSQDLVRGKGSGLVLMLHGVPGVGKTATAEAMAQEHRKPLFAITCGDLGFEPAAVETNLRRIFRLADRWDCILLLDEAEIFFTKRSPSDLQRNALVSGMRVSRPEKLC